ncbi:MAG: hypothetical protein GY787_00580 [Alteromonadales bacterium]|nr:hypothetical protein [Alteromonadales bacterium]
MQQGLPITISADGQFSDSLKPLLYKLEMWINYQALKVNWYGSEDCTLLFDFLLVRRVEERSEQPTNENWIIESGYSYYYNSSSSKTTAFIAVNDLLQNGVGIEKSIKARLVAVANTVAQQHGLLPLS